MDYSWTPNKLPSATVPLHELEEKEALPAHLVRNWPEYSELEVGDVMVSIEHCHNCDSHEWGTHHNEEQYRQVSLSYPVLHITL